MMHSLSLPATPNLIDLFDNQKESRNFVANSFLHFYQSIL